jgi:hypothetical protein
MNNLIDKILLWHLKTFAPLQYERFQAEKAMAEYGYVLHKAYGWCEIVAKDGKERITALGYFVRDKDGKHFFQTRLRKIYGDYIPSAIPLKDMRAYDADALTALLNDKIRKEATAKMRKLAGITVRDRLKMIKTMK